MHFSIELMTKNTGLIPILYLSCPKKIPLLAKSLTYLPTYKKKKKERRKKKEREKREKRREGKREEKRMLVDGRPNMRGPLAAVGRRERSEPAERKNFAAKKI